MQGPSLEIRSWPPLAWLYAQLVLAAVTKGKRPPKKSPSDKEIQVTLQKAMPFDAAKLSRFQTLVGRKNLLQDAEVSIERKAVIAYRFIY